MPLPPPKSCDCQAHIFGDLAKLSRPSPAPPIIPPAASFDDLCAVERTLGFERFVIVHSTLYGPITASPSTCSKPCPTAAMCAADRARRRTTSDAEIEKLHALGACGMRFGFRHDLPRPLCFDTVTRTAATHRAAGLASAAAFPPRHADGECAERLETLAAFPLVVDHLGYPDPALGAADPACRWLVDRLKARSELVGDALERQSPLGDGQAASTTPSRSRAPISRRRPTA